MKKVEIIENKHLPICRKCDGNKTKSKKCSLCKGTGYFNNSSYCLIALKPDGSKIGFIVDQEGK